ncbi:MAG: NAD-dependent epimerase/dehydratase family protein [Leptospiraceae bacterium]|nr:NAD-dependent epimerase/dehydratase family protein [Leptospiraceae bacterium]MCP5502893.1 NAD-dependent epimerase/dehydratase family protein [Leptospiraceae bacterium]
MKETILLTGAGGFVGRYAEWYFLKEGFRVKSIIRTESLNPYLEAEPNLKQNLSQEILEIKPDTDWKTTLRDVHFIIHLAGKAHNLKDVELRPYLEINAEASRQLALEAARQQIKHFIYLSTALVHGKTGSDSPFQEDSPLLPYNSYSLSKIEGENYIKEISQNENLPYTILRPPLIYGPYAKANFLRLAKIAGMGFPLPFKNLKNKRSFIFLGNLLSAIHTCLENKESFGKTYLLSDGQDLSTSELLHLLSESLNKNLVLFPMPLSILKTLFKVIGKSEEYEKISSPYCLDISKIQKDLGWKAPFSIQEGLGLSVKSL